MNYISQLNAFAHMRKLKPLTSSAICLYFVLMEYSNSLGFPERLKVPNSLLSTLASLPSSTFFRASEELIKEGYINYSKGKAKKECGEYEIVEFVFSGRTVDVKSESGDGRYGESSRGSNSGSNVGDTAVTYNKKNKKGANKNYYYSRTRDRYEEGWHDYDFEDIERRALARTYRKSQE